MMKRMEGFCGPFTVKLRYELLASEVRIRAFLHALRFDCREISIICSLNQGLFALATTADKGSSDKRCTPLREMVILQCIHVLISHFAR